MENENASTKPKTSENRTASHVGLSALLGRLSKLQPLPQDTLLMTRNTFERIKTYWPDRDPCDYQNFRTYSPTLYSLPIQFVDEPLKKRVPKSLDRFAEYDERDMTWAEPAGLATWVEVDVDALMVRVRDRIEQQFLIGLM